MPSPTDLVYELFGVGDEPPPPPVPLKTHSIRLDLETTSWVDHIAKEARESRQVVFSHLVQLGLSELINAMPSDLRNRIQEQVFVDLNSQE